MRLVTAVFPVLLLLTACGGGSTDTAPAEPTELASTPSIMTKDEVFIKVLKKEFPELATQSNGDLIDLGETVCEAFNHEVDRHDVYDVLVDSGFTYTSAGGFVGASIATYCPEHAGVIN